MVRRLLTPGRRALLKPVTTLVGSAATVVILVVATSRGQFAEIAGYTAGASVAALVAAVAGSGTSLAYVTGDDEARSAVRRVRHRIVAPVMSLAVVAVALGYSFVTDLSVVAVLCGGLSVVLNHLAELESVSLERELSTPRLLVATVVARFVGLGLLGAGMVSFGEAMLGVAAVGFGCLWVFARSRQTTRAKPTIRRSLRLAYNPSLMTVSVLGVLIGRLVLIVAPLVLSADSAGALSALISAQQNVTGVLISGLGTMMAARVAIGHEQSWMRTFASRAMLLAVCVTVVGVVGTPLVLRLLHVSHVQDAAWVWLLLAVAVLPYTENRRQQYEFLGSKQRQRTVVLLSIVGGASAVCLVPALYSSSMLVLAGVSLVAESAGVIGTRLLYGRNAVLPK